MINEIGFINFPDLFRVVWKPENFELLQTILKNEMKEDIISRKTPGIIFGGAVTFNAGLTVDIAKGLVLFDNGEVLTFDDQQITFPSADPTDPRIDRLELAFTLEDGLTVLNLDNDPKVLNRIHRGTFSVNQGIAAPSPSVPVKTSGNISFGLVSIAATQTILTQNDIDQNNSATEYSETKFDDSLRRIRVNRANGLMELTNNGSDFFPISTLGSSQTPFVVANNVSSPADITGLIFDKTKIQSAEIYFVMKRRDDSESILQTGKIRVANDTEIDEWGISTDATVLKGNPVNELEFSIDLASGQARYISSNMNGGNHSASLTFTILHLITV